MLIEKPLKLRTFITTFSLNNFGMNVRSLNDVAIRSLSIDKTIVGVNVGSVAGTGVAVGEGSGIARIASGVKDVNSVFVAHGTSVHMGVALDAQVGMGSMVGCVC